MLHRIKTHACQAGVILCLVAGQSFAADEAQLIVYELSNPLLDEGALAPSVEVSMTGEVTVFRPAGFKKPGLHEYVLSDTALASLTADIASLDTDPSLSDAPVSELVNQRESIADPSDGITHTIHNTDSTTVSISVPQLDSQLTQRPGVASSVGSLPMTTIQMTQSDEMVQPSADSQIRGAVASTLSRDMNYLYRLPLKQIENNTEVGFDY